MLCLFGQQQRTVRTSVSDYTCRRPRELPPGFDRARCRCTRSLVTSVGRQPPYSDSVSAPAQIEFLIPCRHLLPSAGYRISDGDSCRSRLRRGVSGHVVAWVIHRLRGGRAHAPLNVAAPEASHHFTVSVLFCPDACPAAGDHAHFICFCVPSVRLPVYVHLDGILSLGYFGIHHLSECHSLLRCAFY